MEAIIIKYDEGQLGFIRYTLLMTLGDQSWSIVRRFNDFQRLQEALTRRFPHFQGHLPPKKWFGRFHPEFLRERKMQLQQYLDAVMALPNVTEVPEARILFEVDRRHMGGEAANNRALFDESMVDDSGPFEQARVSAILDDTSRAFINTSSPLHQVSIEQMDPAEISQQRTKLLQRTSGFRGQSSVVHKLACSNHLLLLQQSAQAPHQPQQQSARGGGHSSASAGGGGGGVIDILAAPSRITLGVQAHLLEKQGLCIADQLREARQVRTEDDKDLICQLREERAM